MQIQKELHFLYLSPLAISFIFLFQEFLFYVNIFILQHYIIRFVAACDTCFPTSFEVLLFQPFIVLQLRILVLIFYFHTYGLGDLINQVVSFSPSFKCLRCIRVPYLILSILAIPSILLRKLISLAVILLLFLSTAFQDSRP